MITTADDDACETCGAKLLTASATVNGEDTTMTGNNAIVPLTVMNNKGFVLPKTGGYGTWAYTVGGPPAGRSRLRCTEEPQKGSSVIEKQG